MKKWIVWLKKNSPWIFTDRQDQPRTRHRNRLLRRLRSCKLFRPGISRRAHPAVGHSFDLDRCQRRGQLRIQIEPHRSNRADLFCPASGSGIFPEKRLSEKK